MDEPLLSDATIAALLVATILILPAQAGDPEAGSSGQAEVQMMDANGDGLVSPDEHAAGAKRMFDKMDADRDGNVTAAEMDTAHQAMKKAGHDSKSEMSSADKIRTIDSDIDGILSAEEHAAGSRRMFDKMDRNHDGQLSAGEIDAGHKTMMKKTN